MEYWRSHKESENTLFYHSGESRNPVPPLAGFQTVTNSLNSGFPAFRGKERFFTNLSILDLPVFHPLFHNSIHSMKTNCNLDSDLSKVYLRRLLFQGVEMTGLIHQRQNILPILMLNQVDGRCILSDLPEMGIIQTQNSAYQHLVDDAV